MRPRLRFSFKNEWHLAWKFALHVCLTEKRWCRVSTNKCQVDYFVWSSSWTHPARSLDQIPCLRKYRLPALKLLTATHLFCFEIRFGVELMCFLGHTFIYTVFCWDIQKIRKVSFNFLLYEGFVESYLIANVMAVLIRRWSSPREILHRFPRVFHV